MSHTYLAHTVLVSAWEPTGHGPLHQEFIRRDDGSGMGDWVDHEVYQAGDYTYRPIHPDEPVGGAWWLGHVDEHGPEPDYCLRYGYPGPHASEATLERWYALAMHDERHDVIATRQAAAD